MASGAAVPAPRYNYSYWDVSSQRVADRQRVAVAEEADEFVNRDNFRAQAERLIALYGLREWRRQDIQAIMPFGGGNDGQIFTLFRNDTKHAVKLFRDGVSHQLVAFHEALSRAGGRYDAGVLAIMRRAVVPLAWVQHKGQCCLVFEWIENDPDRSMTDRDQQSVRAQLDVVHDLGFCHLDVTPRNVLLTEDTAILMDYDCVTRIGTSPLCGIAPENCARVQRRDKVRVEDDEHLWRLLFPAASAVHGGPVGAARPPAGQIAPQSSPQAAPSAPAAAVDAPVTNLLDALRRGDERLAADACRQLRTMCADGKPISLPLHGSSVRCAVAADNQVSIARAGGLEAVVGALRRHETSAAVAEQACRTLCNLAANGALQRAAMCDGCACADVVRSRCCARCGVAADNKVSIARAGGLEAVVGALRRHETSAAVAEQACWALRNLAVNGARCSFAWFGFSVCVLTTYATTAVANKASIQRLGGVEAVQAAQRRHGPSVAVGF
jgi:hypothetical protein